MQTYWEHRYARRTQNMQSSAIREILKFTQSPDVISFAGGLPAPEAFPLESIREACDFVLSEIGAQALQYHPTEGYVPLREMLCGFAAEQGFKAATENVLITSGSQQALDLIGKVFINRGDLILVESPRIWARSRRSTPTEPNTWLYPLMMKGCVPMRWKKRCAPAPNSFT